MKQMDLDFEGIFDGIHEYEDEYYILNILFDFMSYCKSSTNNLDKFKIEQKRFAHNKDEINTIIQSTYYFDNFIVEEVAKMPIQNRKRMTTYIENQFQNMPNVINIWYYYLKNSDKYYCLNNSDNLCKEYSEQISVASKKFSLFSNFDFEILNDPEFKEDSARRVGEAERNPPAQSLT